MKRILSYLIGSVLVIAHAALAIAPDDQLHGSTVREVLSQDALNKVQEYYAEGKLFYEQGLYDKAKASFEKAVVFANELSAASLTITTESGDYTLDEQQVFSSPESVNQELKQITSYRDDLEDRLSLLAGRRRVLRRNYKRLSERIALHEKKNEMSLVRQLNNELGQIEGERLQLDAEEADIATRLHHIDDYHARLKIVRATVWFNKGVEYTLQGKQRKALAAYSNALKINPRDNDSRYNRALGYIEREDFYEAASELEKIVASDPDYADAYYNLGVLYADYLHGQAEAEEAFRIFISLKPEGDDAGLVREWLSQYNQ